MIYIKPAVKIKKLLKEYDIDIHALQYALTYILSCCATKYCDKTYILKIACRKCSKNYGLYEFDKRRILICSSVPDKDTFIQTLLHEFRHWIQHNVDKIEPAAIISKGIKYENNAYEQQCLTFEQLTEPLKYLMTLYEDISRIF